MLKSWTPPGTGMLPTLRRGVLVAPITRPYPQIVHIEGHDNLELRKKVTGTDLIAQFKLRLNISKSELPRIVSTRDEARGEIFNFIEMFYNPVKLHSHTRGLSPVKIDADHIRG